MRLVILTAHSPQGEAQHRHVVRRLIEEFGDQVVAVIVATGKHKPLHEKARNWIRRYSPSQILSRIGVQVYRRLAGTWRDRQATYARILFPGGDDGLMPGGARVVRLAVHNSQTCRDLIARLRPDIVVVYGTLVIGRKLIEGVPRIVNLHTGLSPKYRGSDTIFWPLHNGEPEAVGVTVHRLDPGIDSGPILARGRPRIEPCDDEPIIFAKAVQVGANLLCRAVAREIAGTSRPLRQRLEDGVEYRSVDRSLAAERRMRRRLRSGMLSAGLEPWQEEF